MTTRTKTEVYLIDQAILSLPKSKLVSKQEVLRYFFIITEQKTKTVDESFDLRSVASSNLGKRPSFLLFKITIPRKNLKHCSRIGSY